MAIMRRQRANGERRVRPAERVSNPGTAKVAKRRVPPVLERHSASDRLPNPVPPSRAAPAAPCHGTKPDGDGPAQPKNPQGQHARPSCRSRRAEQHAGEDREKEDESARRAPAACAHSRVSDREDPGRRLAAPRRRRHPRSMLIVFTPANPARCRSPPCSRAPRPRGDDRVERAGGALLDSSAISRAKSARRLRRRAARGRQTAPAAFRPETSLERIAALAGRLLENPTADFGDGQRGDEQVLVDLLAHPGEQGGRGAGLAMSLMTFVSSR